MARHAVPSNGNAGFIQGVRLVIAKRKDGSAYIKRRMEGVMFTRQAIHSITPASAPGSEPRGVAA